MPDTSPERIAFIRRSVENRSYPDGRLNDLLAAYDELREQSKIDSLVVGKLQAQVLTATEDTALLNWWEKGEWLIGVSGTGKWQAMSQAPGLIGLGFVGKNVRDVLRQIRDLT